ncbi:MAG: helix-turn-helix transcriptional regulator [Spirochaetaceae bacterium]|nr:helix-turn-helix transcriptional regulator [Spirochaetaceae bacterium]MBR2361663.1 helix-turn-helix transcriptional regulator [Spirochaetaceae bacterium]MBR6565760.1 helix-turn-helix transcriptional regulator [Spirochaetaceae bacterium]
MGTSFKENLREMLDYHDMTVKELAFKTGISKRSIENYLNARCSMPPADYACRIAAALHTTVEVLVNGSDQPALAASHTIKSLDFLAEFERLPAADQNALVHLVHSLRK